MAYNTALFASVATLLLTAPVHAGSLYPKSSAVLQVDAKSYDRLIAKSNYTSIVEFYAPWCGHCQNLLPSYEKAAKSLKGLAKVAAVNCDDEDNKPFCSQMGVQGFPTLKIVRPSAKKGGRPGVEDYQGARSAKAIADAVVEKIPNHVKRVTDKVVDKWLKESNETAKAILFSDKGAASALLRALAIDYLGSINFGQIRDKDTAAVSIFGVEKFPTLVLLPGGDKEAIVYDGELKKEPMSKFLSQVAQPNPDPAPEEPKKKKDTKKSAKPSKAAADKKESSASSEKPTESPESKSDTPPAKEKPVVPDINQEALQKKCFSTTSKICAIVLLPPETTKETDMSPELATALKNIAQVYEKHIRRKAAFPFYMLEPGNPFVLKVRKELDLKGPSGDLPLELFAINAKRGWWKTYTPKDFSTASVDAWVDSIRMNEGKKNELPESLISEPSSDSTEAPPAEPEPEPGKDEAEKKPEETTEKEKSRERDEL